jgi:hypothetical protein
MSKEDRILIITGLERKPKHALIGGLDLLTVAIKELYYFPEQGRLAQALSLLEDVKELIKSS